MLSLASTTVFLWFSCFPFCSFNGPPELQSKLHFSASHSPQPLAFLEGKQGQRELLGCKKLFLQ